MNLALADWLIAALYFISIFLIGFLTARKTSKNSDIEDYILAGRKITLPFFTASLVATWYGNILGSGEFAYNSGLSAWFCFGFPYYIAAGLYAEYMAKRARLSKAKSIPEAIKLKFGSLAGRIASILMLVITLPAPYILMLGALLNLFIGIPLWICVLISGAVSLPFLFKGGLKSDIYTNALQFILMYVGFGAFFYFVHAKFGSLSSMAQRLPDGFLSLTGGASIQVIIVWFIIAMQTFIDPSFHQRSASANSPKTARKGIWLSILCWAIFDFLQFSTALYAKAYLVLDKPMLAYPALADITMPVVWKGVFFVSMLAIIMSTLQSYSFLSASTIGVDILSSFKRIKTDPKKLSQFGLILTAVFSSAIAIGIQSPISIIYKTASITVPALLLPTALSYQNRFEISPKRVILIMALSSACSLIWMILSSIDIGAISEFTRQFEPMAPGLILSVALSLIYIKKSPKRMADTNLF